MPRPSRSDRVRGNFLRMTDLRSRPANISVVANRTTARRRIVEASPPGHHPRASTFLANKGQGDQASPAGSLRTFFPLGPPPGCQGSPYGRSPAGLDNPGPISAHP